MVSVLVTGGAGFVGSRFVRWAINAHDDWMITILDKLTYAGRLENLGELNGHPRHTFVRGDIADPLIAAPLQPKISYEEGVGRFADWLTREQASPAGVRVQPV